MNTHTEVSEINSETTNTCLANIETTETFPQEKNSAQLSLLQRLCRPILLISALITIGVAFYFDLNFGLCNAILLWAIMYLSVCARLIPCRKGWYSTLAEWDLDALYLIITMWGYFSHANINVRLGKLNYLVGGPEQHRLHHSLDIREAGHYSVDIPIWDLLFKSYFWKNGRTPTAVGIKNVTSFPPANAIFSNLLHPFVRNKNYFSSKNSS